MCCVMLQTCDRMSIPMHQVDAHNVVPVWIASDKKETGARTIRKKIHTKLPTYLEVCTMQTAFIRCKLLFVKFTDICHICGIIEAQLDTVLACMCMTSAK